MKEQFVDLLQRSSQEIQRLRADNRVMTARLDTFDKCVALFNAEGMNRNNMSMSPDIVWEIEKYIEVQTKNAD